METSGPMLIAPVNASRRLEKQTRQLLLADIEKRSYDNCLHGVMQSHAGDTAASRAKLRRMHGGDKTNAELQIVLGVMQTDHETHAVFDDE
jgi:hypothetical protein